MFKEIRDHNLPKFYIYSVLMCTLTETRRNNNFISTGKTLQIHKTNKL